MIYFIVHIALILLLFQLMRLVGHYRLPDLPVALVNYLAAAVVALLFGVFQSIDFQHILPTVLLGSVNGILYAVHLLVMFMCIRLLGVGISATVASMSCVSPVIFASLCYQEHMSLLQGMGLLLTPVVLFLCRAPKIDDDRPRGGSRAQLFLTANFLIASTISIIHDAHDRVLSPSQPVYTLCLFVLASLLCAVCLWVTKDKADSNASAQWSRVIRWGGLLGVVNISATMCILMALNEFAAALIFPVAACSVIIGTSILGYYLWKESLITRQLIGLFGAVAVIVLMNN